MPLTINARHHKERHVGALQLQLDALVLLTQTDQDPPYFRTKLDLSMWILMKAPVGDTNHWQHVLASTRRYFSCVYL